MIAISEKNLINRYGTLINLKVKDIPFVMGQGLYMGSEKLEPEDTIEQALKNGTLTIGFIGLAETLVALTGKHHAESEEAQKLGLEIVGYIRERCNALSEKHNLNFSLIATPAEGLSNRFLNLDKKKFGVIPGITDKGHYTNSCHVPVAFPISIEDKIKIEAPYHKLCNAGIISYVELGGMPTDNVEGLYKILKLMYEADIHYSGVNFPLDYCNDCHYLGTIDDNTCPVCGSNSIRSTRRVSGYFSTSEKIGHGKTDEIEHRVAHAGRAVSFAKESTGTPK